MSFTESLINVKRNKILKNTVTDIAYHFCAEGQSFKDVRSFGYATVEENFATSVHLLNYCWKCINLCKKKEKQFRKWKSIQCWVDFSHAKCTVAWTPSNWRPPWFETPMADTPCCTASSASSGRRIPFTTIGSLVMLKWNRSRPFEWNRIAVFFVVQFTFSASRCLSMSNWSQTSQKRRPPNEILLSSGCENPISRRRCWNCPI